MAVSRKPKTKRQLVEDARRAALEGRWDESLGLNQALAERYPRDAEVQNRIGRAVSEMRRYTAAWDAYSEALRIDPANMIARRNLQRLELLGRRQDAEPGVEDQTNSTVIPRTTVFIEEIGKTWVDELVNPVSRVELAEVSSGELLRLEVKDDRLHVMTTDGRALGEVEAKTATRMIDLISGGNRYEVYALGLSATSLRVILREAFRDQSQAQKVSFPRQIRATRDLLRERDLLFQRDEADFIMSDDDDDEETAADGAEELEPGDNDSDTYSDEPVAVDEEERTL